MIQQTGFIVFSIRKNYHLNALWSMIQGSKYLFRNLPSMSLRKNDAEQESARDDPDYNPHCMRRVWTNVTFREKEK